MRQFAAAGRRSAEAVFLQEQIDFTAVDRASEQVKMVRLRGKWLCNVISYRNTGSNMGVVELEVHKIWGASFKKYKKILI